MALMRWGTAIESLPGTSRFLLNRLLMQCDKHFTCALHGRYAEKMQKASGRCPPETMAVELLPGSAVRVIQQALEVG